MFCIFNAYLLKQCIKLTHRGSIGIAVGWAGGRKLDNPEQTPCSVSVAISQSPKTKDPHPTLETSEKQGLA